MVSHTHIAQWVSQCVLKSGHDAFMIPMKFSLHVRKWHFTFRGTEVTVPESGWKVTEIAELFISLCTKEDHCLATAVFSNGFLT